MQKKQPLTWSAGIDGDDGEALAGTASYLLLLLLFFTGFGPLIFSYVFAL